MTSTPADAEGSRHEPTDAEHRAVTAQLGTLGELSGQYIRDLVDASREQTASSIQMASAMVEYQERAKLAARRYRITIALIVAFFSALLIRQEVGNQAARDARHTLIDCVQADGQCYKDGQKRTGAYLDGLEHEAVVRAACEPEFVNLSVTARIDAIEHCIARHLHKH